MSMQKETSEKSSCAITSSSLQMITDSDRPNRPLQINAPEYEDIEHEYANYEMNVTGNLFPFQSPNQTTSVDYIADYEGN